MNMTQLGLKLVTDYKEVIGLLSCPKGFKILSKGWGSSGLRLKVGADGVWGLLNHGEVVRDLAFTSASKTCA